MKTTFTLEEVTNAINITAIIGRQIGTPKEAAAYMRDNVPEELHAPIMAALLGVAIFPAIAGSDNDIDEPRKEEPKCSCSPKCSCKQEEEDSEEEEIPEIVKHILGRVLRGF